MSPHRTDQLAPSTRRLIFELDRQGFMPSEIARQLNGRAIPTPRGLIWTAGNVSVKLRQWRDVAPSQLFDELQERASAPPGEPRQEAKFDVRAWERVRELVDTRRWQRSSHAIAPHYPYEQVLTRIEQLRLTDRPSMSAICRILNHEGPFTPRGKRWESGTLAYFLKTYGKRFPGEAERVEQLRADFKARGHDPERVRPIRSRSAGVRPHSRLQADAQQALRELKAQGLGPTAIANKLNERGIATATGARWHRTTVDLTLRKLRDLDERIAAWETRRATLRTERVPREPEDHEEATRLTWRQAAAVMNAEGFRTPTGALYTRDTIRRLLEMPRPDSSAR